MCSADGNFKNAHKLFDEMSHNSNLLGLELQLFFPVDLSTLGLTPCSLSNPDVDPNTFVKLHNQLSDSTTLHPSSLNQRAVFSHGKHTSVGVEI
jgi:hypothetical protein